MRRSNRHHPSSAAADALSPSRSPSRKDPSGTSGRRSSTESKTGSRNSSASGRDQKQTLQTEPRRQRAAAVAAKDAMSLIANHGLGYKEDAKPLPSNKRETPMRQSKRSSGTSATDSGSPLTKIGRSSESENAISCALENENVPSTAAALDRHSSVESGNIISEVSASVTPDISSFPRELTVKEVIAKTMRVNRISMRGLSREIVGLMKEMPNDEIPSANNIAHLPTIEQALAPLAPSDNANKSHESSKDTLDAVIDGVLNMAKSPSLTSVTQSNLNSFGNASDSNSLSPKPKQQRYSSVSHSSSAERFSGGSLAPTKLSDGNGYKVSSEERNSSETHADEEMVVDVVGDGSGPSYTPNRELSVSEKVLVIADFDAGMLPHELEQKYNITKLQVADVLANRISIIRQQACSLSDRLALKRRRTNFVGLNIMMWRFFCDCRDQGIVLNGRQLKEHALTIARQLGLHNFKGSEGWLDSFKRRHNIDLKTMTGQPVIYETDSDGNVLCADENFVDSTLPVEESPRGSAGASTPTIVDANQFLIDAADAAARAANSTSNSFSPASNLNTLAIAAFHSGANDLGPSQATAAVHTTQPLDLTRMLPGTSTSMPMPVYTKTSPRSIYLGNAQHGMLPSVAPQGDITMSTIQALVETCCYRVDEPEVSRAVETLRSYITTSDISLLPTLVELQKGLSVIAARKKQKEAKEAMSVASSERNSSSDFHVNDESSEHCADMDRVQLCGKSVSPNSSLFVLNGTMQAPTD